MAHHLLCVTSDRVRLPDLQNAQRKISHQPKNFRNIVSQHPAARS
jgi:hypothetical protein